jgi:N-acetylmuramoyl-L-alanine amidase CwlA
MNMTITWDWLKQKSFRLNDPNLHPTVAQRAWEVVFEAWKRGIYVLITQAYRSIAEQNELYAQGRTKPGKIVTNAKGGTSYHNYGLAVDMALYTPDGKSVVWDTDTDFNENQKKDWMEVVALFKARGFKWGGDFKSFKDMPHFEMTFGFSIAQLKAGERPSRPSMTVQVPEPIIIDKKEEKYTIPTAKADRILAILQAQWQEKDGQIKQYQVMWQAENAKADKCPQKLDEFHRAADALRKEQRELAELADEIRKASGRKAVNG